VRLGIDVAGERTADRLRMPMTSNLSAASIHNPDHFAIGAGLALTAAGRFRHSASHRSTRGKPDKSARPSLAQESTEATLRSATVKVGPTKKPVVASR
jgi:hypothetical protein